MKEAAIIICAYLIGSIPTALIISKKFFEIDIREYGSGNMGATNTFRVLGKKYGIVVIVEPRLPNTLLDGAAMLTEDGLTVVGLTLRHDRVDYFWFTLLHEVAHICRHLNTKDDAFIDRIENMGSKVVAEKEANRIARDACIPRALWKRSPAFLAPTKKSIQSLADELHIHPAIVAGRLQFETGRYENFREFLGQGSVRQCFPDLAFK